VGEELLWRPSFGGIPSPPYQSCEIHPGAFTPRQCDRIVDLCSRLASGDAVLEAEDGGEVGDDGVRRARVAWVPAEDDTWWIYEKLGRVAEKANRRYGFELSGFDEDLQFTIYDEPGAFYSWHQDGLDGRVGRRKLSMVLQLSDPADYEGGQLQMFDLAEDADVDELDEFERRSSERGTVVVFPSFEYHRVLPIRSGTRLSLVTWVSGPPFR
jgi:PKHD-type hydroxylase